MGTSSSTGRSHGSGGSGNHHGYPGNRHMTYPGQRAAAAAAASATSRPTTALPGTTARMGTVIATSNGPRNGAGGPERIIVRRPGTTGTSGNNNNSNNATVTLSNNNGVPPASPTTAQTISAPGAYSISRNDAGPTQVFRVNVPPGVTPGREFQVYAGPRVVRVRCPPDVRPGQSLQITVPPDPVVTQNLLGMAPLTSADGEGGGGAVRMADNVARINAQREAEQHQQQDQSASTTTSSSPGDDPAESDPTPTPPPPPQPQAYMVTVPPGVRPGQQFPVNVAGQQMLVQCPPNARAGMSVRIVPPTPPPPPADSSQATSLDRPPDHQLQQPNNTAAQRPPLTHQMFEVIVPAGVRPDQPFALIAGGQRVLVTCPPNAHPGQRIRFQLPVSSALSNSSASASSHKQSVESIKLSYDKDGCWTRTIRVTDMKFQWVRMDDKGDVDLHHRFDIRQSAYVRNLILLEGNDSRMRTGRLTLVPASEATVESRVLHPITQQELLSYGEIATAQTKPYTEKVQWFSEACQKLMIHWNDGHMRIHVRRAFLLQDSMSAVMSLSRDDLRKVWRFEFMGEAGIDAGGLAREWFQLISEQIFDPDNGLWLTSSGGNQMYMRINPASEISCPEDHLVYFRFLGRLMGKALFDRQLVVGHMVRPYYKHLLGWPITFDDLEMIDEGYYQSLKKLNHCDDVSVLCLDFTATEETLGMKKVVDLIENGSDTEVTEDNLPEYLEACLKYRMLDRIRPQLTELMLGFFDVIPEPLLTVFDFQELELLMCGMPNIDIEDWMEHTLYTGSFETSGVSHKVCRWFWEVVRNEFDRETRARLLQFVTGTSGVPSRGFSVLQGNDGNIRKFTIHGVPLNICLYPRAHTCFNRIDLPLYESKNELQEKLKVAVTMQATGFDIE